MKQLLLFILLILGQSVFAECKVEITEVKTNCDGNGSSCYNYYFDNKTDKDFMACIWDDKTKGGYAFCTYADRNYKESFKDVLVGLVDAEKVKKFKTGCLTNAESDKLYE